MSAVEIHASSPDALASFLACATIFSTMFLHSGQHVRAGSARAILTFRGKSHDLRPEDNHDEYKVKQERTERTHLVPKIFISDFASERRKTSGAKRRELAFQIGKRWRLLLVKRFACVELVENLLHQIGGAKRGRSPRPPWSKKKDINYERRARQ